MSRRQMSLRVKTVGASLARGLTVARMLNGVRVAAVRHRGRGNCGRFHHFNKPPIDKATYPIQTTNNFNSATHAISRIRLAFCR
jgi:hypothetical protein